MANFVRGEVAVTSNGDLYTLQLTTAGMVAAQAAVSTPGKRIPFRQILQGVFDGDIEYTAVFLWAALRAHHKQMTLEDVYGFIDGAGGVYALQGALIEIVKSTRPDPEDAAAAGEPADDGRPHVAQADTVPTIPTVTGGRGDRSTGNRVKSA